MGDPMAIGGWCVAGTDMGTKMEAAITECYNGPTEEAEGRAGKKGKGKAGKKKPGKGGKGGEEGETQGGKGGKKKPGKGGKGGKEKAEREENAHPTMRSSAKLILRPQMSSASWRRWDGLITTTTSFRMFTTLTWLLSTQFSLTEWMNRSSRNAQLK